MRAFALSYSRGNGGAALDLLDEDLSHMVCAGGDCLVNRMPLLYQTDPALPPDVSEAGPGVFTTPASPWPTPRHWPIAGAGSRPPDHVPKNMTISSARGPTGPPGVDLLAFQYRTAAMHDPYYFHEL